MDREWLSRIYRIYIVKYDDKTDDSITSLDAGDNEALLAALKSDNLFWRITAQRLIVEEGKKELVGELIAMAEDGLGQNDEINAPVLHALWTLDGLGAFDGEDAKTQDLLKKALERGKLCSNDPFCSQHKPNNQFEKRYSHGAACHSCLLIAETSCERKNEFLDRSLLVPTLEEKDAAFFD